MVNINNDNRANCTGCTACVNICPQHCITMKKDKMGFAYPNIDTAKCIRCGLCEEACPTCQKSKFEDKCFLESYAAQCLDYGVRLASSSGGLFMLIAKYVISQKGVVFGASFDNTFHKVHHISIETIRDLHRIQGSKYVQSDIGDSYQEAKTHLEQERKVLFSGTPCQIAGLKAFLNKEYENLYTIDVVCHGVPSPAVFDEYVGFLEDKNKGKVTRLSFRDKRNGWRDYVFSVKFDNGREYINNRLDDLYMRGFLHDYYLRPSCFCCKHKGINRISDITLGDLWGVDKICLDLDDDKGTSLVIISSKKGKQLFEEVTGDINYQQININEAVKFNPAIVKSSEYNPESVVFEKMFGEKPIKYLLKKFCSKDICKKIINKALSMIGFR